IRQRVVPGELDHLCGYELERLTRPSVHTHFDQRAAEEAAYPGLDLVTNDLFIQSLHLLHFSRAGISQRDVHAHHHTILTHTPASAVATNVNRAAGEVIEAIDRAGEVMRRRDDAMRKLGAIAVKHQYAHVAAVHHQGASLDQRALQHITEPLAHEFAAAAVGHLLLAGEVRNFTDTENHLAAHFLRGCLRQTLQRFIERSDEIADDR